MIALHYIYSYISRWILTVKAAGLNPHSSSHWKRLSRRWPRRLVPPQLSCYTSFGLLNISITFSNAHLVLLCYIFRFSNGFKHVKMSRMPQQSQFFLLRVCGDFTTVAQHRTITSLLRTAYFHYFDCKIGDHDKSSAPHICCKPCYNAVSRYGLMAWFNSKKAAFNFAVPMVWREPRNHAGDCYFYLTNMTGFNASSRKKDQISQPSICYSDDLPVPTPPVNKDLLSSSDEEMPSRKDSAESISFEDIESTSSGTSGNEPHWITQEDLNDLAHDLYLSKQQSELLASRLKQWNQVQEDVRITSFRNPFSTWETSCATAQTYLACLRPLVCHIILQTGVVS